MSSHSTPSTPRPVQGLGRAVIVASASLLVADLVTTAAAYRVQDDLERAALDGSPVFTAYDAAGLVQLLVGLVALVLTGAWLSAARSNVEMLRPDLPHARSRVWAWLGWIVPVVNLWFPFQVVRDVSRRRGDEPTPSMLGWWWASWLLALFLERLATQLGGTPDTADAVASGEALASVALVAAFVLWVVVIHRVGGTQRVLAVDAPGWIGPQAERPATEPPRNPGR